jgi:hypothetical protein
VPGLLVTKHAKPMRGTKNVFLKGSRKIGASKVRRRHREIDEWTRLKSP